MDRNKGGGTRPWSRMSPVFRLMCCYSARVVRHWYTITGCSAIVRHTQTYAGSICIWLNFGPLPFGRRPKPSGSQVVYQSRRLSYRRCRILFAAFDHGIRTMSPRSASPVGRYSQSCRKFQLVPHHQRSFRQSSRMLGQLRPMFRRRRGHAHFSMVGGHLYCRCRCRFRNSPTTILCRLLSSLSWSQLSHIHHLWSHVLPRSVLIDRNAAISIISGVTCFHGLCWSGRFSFRGVRVEWRRCFGIACRKDHVSVSSVHSGDNYQTDMAIEVSRWTVLNRR